MTGFQVLKHTFADSLLRLGPDCSANRIVTRQVRAWLGRKPVDRIEVVGGKIHGISGRVDYHLHTDRSVNEGATISQSLTMRRF